MTTLTPREVDSLHFAVRADRQALSHTRIVSAVEEIVAARLARVEDVIAQIEQGIAAGLGGDRAHTIANIARELRAALDGAS